MAACGVDRKNIFLVNKICTPLSYESLVTLTQFIFEARQCFGRGMIKYNALGLCNLFFKYLETTLRYTIVRLFPNDILLHIFSSFQHTVLPLDTGKKIEVAFLVSVNSITILAAASDTNVVAT